MAQENGHIPLIDEDDDQVTQNASFQSVPSTTNASAQGNERLDTEDGSVQSCLRAQSGDGGDNGTDVGATRQRNTPGAHVLVPPKTVTVVVEPATILQEPSEDIYKMTAPTRGFCLIINNLDFIGRPDHYRSGSKEEGELLRQLFTELGFEVEQVFDASKDEMKRKFNDYSKKHENWNYDAFIGVILSHGGENNLVHGIDNMSVEVEELIDNFNNLNCPALIDKPKIFFVQACRGWLDDHGVAVEFTSTSVDALHPELAAQVNRRVLPTWGDTVVCYSTVNGFTSSRNTSYGSWFGDALIKVICEFSCELELNDLFRKVNNMLKLKEGGNRLRQSLEIVYRGWAKKFYFNPHLSSA